MGRNERMEPIVSEQRNIKQGFTNEQMFAIMSLTKKGDEVMPGSKYQSERVERISTETPGSAKTVVVPQVESMRHYILKHHKRRILTALNAWLVEMMRPIRVEQGDKAYQLDTKNCTFAGMSFWRIDTYTLLADVVVKVRLSGQNSVRECPLYCELWVDMRNGMSIACGECGYLVDRTEREYWMLNEYLVPILRKEEIEEGAEHLLYRYCPEAFQDPQAHRAGQLAQRMGLEVVRAPLHQRIRTRSILYFREGSVLIAETDEAGSPIEAPHRITIPAGTIVINTNAVHKDQCELEIYHECIHYDWHYMFFRLQDMYHSDINVLRIRHRVVVDEEIPENPLTWMEWQARRGSFGLMMPLSVMRPMIMRLSEEMRNSQLHAGERLDRIARSIAAERDWPRFRVRARLIQMGYVEAKGTLNYVDGKYIAPFAFSRANGDGKHSFVIDRTGVFMLYSQDEAFRKLLQSGQYVFADGHLCRNDQRYVGRSFAGMKLTPWANAHVDECCLRFVQVYEACGLAEYCFGELNSDEEYNRQYLEFAAGKGNNSKHEQLAKMRRVLEEMPSTFPDALTYLMRRAHMTIERLEEKTFISGRTISRLRTEERSEYSVDQVIAICVALHLPPWLSRELLQRAGLLLRKSKQHLAYQCVLDCMFMDEVEDVQRFLAETGLDKLKIGSHEG